MSISSIPNFLLKPILKITPMGLFYRLRKNITRNEKSTKKIITLGITDFLVKRGEKRALYILKETAKRIPAYENFLKEQGVSINDIKNAKSIKDAPISDKASYIRPNEDNPANLCVDGNMSPAKMIETSSGYSGKHTYWLRDLKEVLREERQIPVLLSIFYDVVENEAFAINGFALSSWVTGIQAGNASRRKTATINIGLNPPEIAQTIADFYKRYSIKSTPGGFKKALIMSYPPTIKTVLDILDEMKFNEWGNLEETIFVSGGDGFPESYREYIKKKTAGGTLFSVYGSADTGIQVGIESPDLIKLRGYLDKNPGRCREFFGKDHPPMLFYYDPTHVYIETVESETGINELILTPLYKRRLPLIRYNIHDEGGVFYNPKRELTDLLDLSQIELNYSLPIFYVYGRSDGSIAVFSAYIYPQQIQAAIIRNMADEFCQHFHISSEYSENQKPQLVVDICVSTKPSAEQIDNLRSDILNSNQDLGVILSEGLADPAKINFYSKEGWPWETARGPGQKERYLGASRKKK
ncbi:MAG: phenylacetate--CoA ligase family protein [Promethearchaeota archaeon]